MLPIRLYILKHERKEKIMKCKNCEMELKENAKFCTKCGCATQNEFNNQNFSEQSVFSASNPQTANVYTQPISHNQFVPSNSPVSMYPRKPMDMKVIWTIIGVGVILAILVFYIAEQNNKLNTALREKEQYQQQVDDYNNRSNLDKMGDGLDGLFNFLFD